MKHLFETMFGWLGTTHADDVAAKDAEQRLRELQERGRVQFLP